MRATRVERASQHLQGSESIGHPTDNANDGTVKVDRNGIIDGWNAAAEQLSGSLNLSAIGNPLELINPSRPMPAIGRALRAISSRRQDTPRHGDCGGSPQGRATGQISDFYNGWPSAKVWPRGGKGLMRASGILRVMKLPQHSNANYL